jgi:serine/threonine-protein kinase
VSPTFVESNEPANTVIDQTPAAGESAGKGTQVDIKVSKGPTTSTVPDVSSTDLGSAEQTLRASGFRWSVVYQDVGDPSSDGIVLSQNPAGAAQAPAKSVVTLTVGRYTGAATDTTTTP